MGDLRSKWNGIDCCRGEKLSYITLARKRSAVPVRRRTLADSCVIDPRTGGRVCTGDQNLGPAPSPLPLQIIISSALNQPAGSPAQSSLDYYLQTTSAAEQARQNAILNMARPGRPSRDYSNTPAAIIANAAAAQAAATTAAAPATSAVSAITSLLPAGIADQLTASTWISGVPNWGVLIGAGAVFYMFSKKRRR
ncbi:MAG: hypothetical protein JWO13_818 [Acidobacteriales bacterium]|nr:hypothetical protein [Terriglobales bacterium]